MATLGELQNYMFLEEKYDALGDALKLHIIYKMIPHCWGQNYVR